MSRLMQLSKITIATLALLLSVNTAHAAYKFNPYTGKLDYYETETASSIATKLSTTVLPVASGGTGNAINAGRLYGYQHTASSIYSASTPTGLAWTASPLNEVTLYSFTIPALGVNDVLQIITFWSNTNSANIKTAKIKFGTSAFLNFQITTTASFQSELWIRNRNNASSQVSFVASNPNFSGTTTGLPNTQAVNFTQEQTLTVTGTTTLEAGFSTTAVVGLAGTCTATKASHGLNSGEYVQAAGGGNCPTSGNPNADPVIITVSDVNTFAYACSCVGTEAGTQPTVKRYSVIQLESVDVQILKP